MTAGLNFQTALETVIASKAKQSKVRYEEWIASSASLLAMTSRYDFAISPRLRASFAGNVLPI
jgi:hypothetical protein